MNIEENIDYIFLNILKYYQKSNFVHKQNMLKTKIIPSLNDMKNMEKYI